MNAPVNLAAHSERRKMERRMVDLANTVESDGGKLDVKDCVRAGHYVLATAQKMATEIPSADFSTLCAKLLEIFTDEVGANRYEAALIDASLQLALHDARQNRKAV